jgi:predicted nucleic acid-binding protein
MKFTIDTNLYVRAFRSPDEASALRSFFERTAPQIFLSSVVLHELEVGGSSEAVTRWVETTARPLTRTRRVVTPSHTAWRTAGSAIARLAGEHRVDRRTVPRSLVNDVLIAATCRESGVTLVTDNAVDFEMIRSVLPFDFVAPWP